MKCVCIVIRSGEGKVESARKAIVLDTLPVSEQKGKNTEALIKLRALCHKIR